MSAKQASEGIDEIRQSDIEKRSFEPDGASNSEGTYHQSQLPPRPWYKALYLKPSDQHAAAVHADAQQVVYDEAEEKQVRKKIDCVVLPLVVGAYICTSIWKHVFVG
jgi:hypothetical protein